MKNPYSYLNKVLSYLFERELTFDDIKEHDKIQLFAGDLGDRIEKNDYLVGLVLHKGAVKGIYHDPQIMQSVLRYHIGHYQ